MLINSSGLTLSAEEAALPSGTPLILWNNIISFGGVSTNSTAAGYPASNLANPATNQEWRAATAAAVEVLLSPSTADFIDSVGVARHNFGSAGIQVELGYYNLSSPAVWVSLSTPQIPADDEPLLFHFTAQALVDVTLKLAAGSEAARAAVAYVGKLLIMERGLDVDRDFALPKYARRTEAVNSRSERGDFLGRIVTSQYVDALEFSFSHLRRAWYDTYAEPFVQAAQQEVPFFLAIKEDTSYAVAYAWLTDDPIPMTSPITRRKKLILKIGAIVE